MLRIFTVIAFLLLTPVLFAQEDADFFKPIPGSRTSGPFTFEVRENKTILLKDAEQPVLGYVYDVITNESVPEKEAKRRTRGCYIHPLFGLNGEVFTDDFPKDHYHHHGVFWAWPHVQIEGKSYDLWTDNTDMEQRFVAWKRIETSGKTALLEAENGWFVGDKKVMRETALIEVHPKQTDSRAIDITLSFTPVDHPVVLRGAEGKSYGGLAIRFKAGKDSNGRDFSQIIVPNGVTREDLPDTPLAWADFSSYFSGRKSLSGTAVFIPKTHPDHPPTWLTRHYGALCIGWPGVKDRTFEPGKTFTLSYRIWIHQNEADLDRLKKEYSAFTEPFAATPVL
ncbi:MAG: PmoA family protein [Planctomycetaceae bacterium]|jgi:hypothetical protein|nr:PmoA family protein [Planctomycetaceae bacterium]